MAEGADVIDLVRHPVIPDCWCLFLSDTEPGVYVPGKAGTRLMGQMVSWSCLIAVINPRQTLAPWSRGGLFNDILRFSGDCSIRNHGGIHSAKLTLYAFGVQDGQVDRREVPAG